jgi:aminoglycoside phosphotransferase (APT) family kinase protein
VLPCFIEEIHIIVAGTHVAAFIDWEEAAIGDPRIDVCWLAAALHQTAPAYADLFLANYQQAAGALIGDLAIWSELLEVRYQIVYAWIQRALAEGRVLPSANPEAWPA